MAEVYTGRITKLNLVKFPERGYLPVFICRYLNPLVSKYKGTQVHCTDLSPSSDLLFKSKKGEIDFEEYTNRYLSEIEKVDVKGIISFYSSLSNSIGAIGVVLMCYCQDKNKCHRGLLSDYLKDSGILDYKPKELVL